LIDACLCSAPDLPNQPGLHTIPLPSMPMDLLVKPGHPLLDLGDQLDWEHLADFPVLSLLDGAFAKAQAVLEALGLWSCPERDRRFQQAPWFGLVPVEEWMISFGTPLPLSLPIRVGEAVVVKREFAANPNMLSLLAALGERARLLACGLVEVELLLPSESELAER
jgi:DNA-binding transcriptional LysR family regulator